MITITQELLRRVCLISPTWISNRNFAIEKTLVQNAALFVTEAVAKVAFPKIEHHLLATSGIEKILPKDRERYTVTDWIYNNGDEDFCLFLNEEKNPVYIHRQYYLQIVKPLGLHQLWGAESTKGCVIFTDMQDDQKVRFVLAAISKKYRFPAIEYGRMDQLLSGSRKLDL